MLRSNIMLDGVTIADGGQDIGRYNGRMVNGILVNIAGTAISAELGNYRILMKVGDDVLYEGSLVYFAIMSDAKGGVPVSADLATFYIDLGSWALDGRELMIRFLNSTGISSVVRASAVYGSPSVRPSFKYDVREAQTSFSAKLVSFMMVYNSTSIQSHAGADEIELSGVGSYRVDYNYSSELYAALYRFETFEGRAGIIYDGIPRDMTVNVNLNAGGDVDHFARLVHIRDGAQEGVVRSATSFPFSGLTVKERVALNQTRRG